MRIFLLLFLMLLTLSCSTRSINYKREKILNKYSSKYEIYIDSEKVDLKNYYLDKDNIKKITLDKKSKSIQIHQIKKTELFELKKMNLDSLNYRKKGNIGLVIIDGVPYAEEDLQKIKMDPNSIKSITFLIQEKTNELLWCKAHDGDILLITTK